MNKYMIGNLAAIITMVASAMLILTEMFDSRHVFKIGNIISYVSLFVFAAFLFILNVSSEHNKGDGKKKD